MQRDVAEGSVSEDLRALLEMALLHRWRHSAGSFLQKHGKTIGSVLATAAAVASTAHRVHQAIQGRPYRAPVTHHGIAPMIPIGQVV